MTQTLRSARKHYNLSSLIARRGVREANAAQSRGAVASTVASHQIAQATASQNAIAEMLAEQGIAAPPEARLNVAAFTTGAALFEQMSEAAGPAGFDRLVASLVQDAGRAAESVATAVRRDVFHTRYLSPPSCSRCAVLAGRVYRYSDGFQRHPNCDCTMVPTSVGNRDFVHDPGSLMRQGLITGLSKADQQAVREGADLGQVVNVRSRAAGLTESGRVLARAGRPTPEGIYRMSSSRTEAVALLRRFGYVR